MINFILTAQVWYTSEGTGLEIRVARENKISNPIINT